MHDPYSEGMALGARRVIYRTLALHRLGCSGAPGRTQDTELSEAMPWLRAEVHRQVVLQRHVDRSEVVVDTHIGQRGHVGRWDWAHVEREVVEHGPDGRQGEGRVHEGIGGDLWLVQVLRDGPRQGFDPLDFLWRLLQGGPDAFEGVL